VRQPQRPLPTYKNITLPPSPGIEQWAEGVAGGGDLPANYNSVFRQTNKPARKKVKFHAKIKGFRYFIASSLIIFTILKYLNFNICQWTA